MKISKFLLIISCVTFISLLYVHQQTEILRLAYVIQKKAEACEDLLDKNAILRYNLERSISLVRISQRVSNLADFQIPDSYRLVRLTPSERTLRSARQGLNREGLVSRLFGIKRQAEAKTVNP